MAQKTREELHDDVPINIKSYGAISVDKTTGDSLRAMLRDIIDSMLTTYEGIPIGGIILWSGTVNNIPQYWQLCDGTNGTPNLIDKFVRGRGPLTTTFSGGQDQFTILPTNLPPHNHQIQINIPAHTHSGHVIEASGNWSGGGHDSSPNSTSKPGETSSAGGFSGTLTTYNSLGGFDPINNMPVYYSLCYIQYMGLGAPVDLLPPSSVDPVNAMARVDGIDISWLPAYDAFGVDRYDVYVDNVLIASTAGNVVSYAHNFNIVPFQIYTIRVEAFDEAGNFSISTNVTTVYVKTPDAFNIDPDRNNRTDTTIDILFNVTPENRAIISGYELYWSRFSTGPWILATGNYQNPNITRKTVTSLVPNRTHYFRARAYRSVGGNTIYGPYTPTVYAATRPSVITTTTTTTMYCPVEGTLVTLWDGTEVKIENLVAGDKLLSANIDTYIDSNSKEVLDWSNSKLDITDAEGIVGSIEKHEVDRTICLNGVFTVSEHHTHLVRKQGYWKFVQITDVSVGDFMYEKGGKIVEIESVEVIDKPQNVYKISMSTFRHVFYANNILTHNKIDPNDDDDIIDPNDDDIIELNP
jgi:hypothetical protein